MEEELRVVTWNIHGLGDGDRLRALKNWLANTGKNTRILGLQELKAGESRLDFNIKQLMPGETCFVDYSSTDRGGSALIIYPSIRVEAGGTRGNGSCAWAKIHTSVGLVGISSLADSAGPTTVLQGDLLAKWREVELHWDLLDMYERVAIKEGPKFTRQVWRGERLDQARLDRVYLNCHGEWIEAANKIKHDGEETLSDHIPVRVDLRLTKTHRSRKKRGSYLKMDAGTLKDPEKLRQVIEAWLEGWKLALDPTEAWEIAWGKVREKFQDFREEEKRKFQGLKAQKEELETIRCKMTEDHPTVAERTRCEELERVIKEAELLECSILRRRSRLQWIKEGDECSGYFFKFLKTKQNRERISSLITEGGERELNEDNILGLIERFYRDLYSKQTITAEGIRDRTEALALIDRRVMAEENDSLLVPPDTSELEDIIGSMALKAPGEDGAPVEVLAAMWSSIKEECALFFISFWETQRLGRRNKTGVIKLLPKNEEKELLKNWRPISLLPLAYKITGKILSTRLKAIVPRLVDSEQCGFIEGRSIMDNVMCLRLSQEIAQERREPALFCKLDFVKAFDRVEHNFLWETLRAMGFSQDFISLAGGLIAQGTAKVHVNGLFTGSFPLERGVRQGCPVSPTLFVLSTQPLVRMFREAERKGDLEGLNIPRGRPLLHRLFADDSGVTIWATESNFNNLTKIIEKFESFSGAQLNLAKSVVIPMALERLPPWLLTTGCSILGEGEEITYLGGQGNHRRSGENTGARHHEQNDKEVGIVGQPHTVMDITGYLDQTRPESHPCVPATRHRHLGQRLQPAGGSM
ncbi:hypothetical protein R1sor_008689 [Riccia sorocarpa]|uniref:Reverse transcriptase domain-containing protein n=1 Tax=Riccia sorocarpa TaxID=122646 RepID=A0ABD3HUC2_9MARC